MRIFMLPIDETRPSNLYSKFGKLKTLFFLIKNNLSLNPHHLFFLLRHSVTLFLLTIETKQKFKTNFGDFNWGRDCRPHRLRNPTGEGGAILGEVVLFVKTTPIDNRPVLLAGDRNEVKAIWKKFLPNSKISTAGIHKMDYPWNYENDPPNSLKENRFGLIISQAVLEHLIDPYKHFCDLVSLLDNGGYLVIHTVLPGFFYHRVPIDCFRFYPDWFETVAVKLGLEIVDKQISTFNITYKFRLRNTR